MNKKIILALLGLALGSCGGTPASSSSNPSAGSSSDIGSSSASQSSTDSGTASSDSGSASTSDSGASSSDSGSGGGSSSDSGSSSSSSGGESSGGESSGGESSGGDSGSDTSSGTGTGGTDVLTEERKEKIIDFLTKDNGGMTEGTFVADVDILTPLALGFDGTKVCQNIQQAQTMAFHYRVGDKKALNQIRVGMGFRIDVGKGVAAYEELSEIMGVAMPPAPQEIDVKTEEGAVAYFKYFLEFMSSSAGQETTFNCEKRGDYYAYSSNQMSGLTQSTYIVESADHLDFYTWDGNEKNYVHGSAPLGTETIHGLYRSPLGGNFIQYARTHLEKVSAAIKEEGVGLLTIKFSELAKDPEAAGVKIFGETGLSYVPDMSVSFDNSGSIHGFNGSLKTEGGEVKVEALIRSEDDLPITAPTNAVECEHSYPYVNTFEDEQGGGHYHYCIQCHSVFDYGHHEYHEGDEHCHVCDYVETAEAPLKEGVVLPETLSGLKVIESKATGNFLRIECLDDMDMYRGTTGSPLDGNYHVEFETQIKGEEDSYHVLAVGTQLDGQAGCLYPMHWVVSYAKYVEGEPETPVVIYEKTSMLEYHETQPKVIDGMGDACHVYTVGECQVCHQEYGFPERTVEHEIEKQANQDGSITLTCSKCHESAVVSIGKAEPLGEAGHSVGYDYVSGNREIYEFFAYNVYPEDHVYEDGVCTVCGYETTRKQVVVDVSSYVGEAATITLSLDKDRGQQVIAEASTSYAVPMAARVPDSEEYRQGFGLESHQDFIVVVEPVRTPVPETTCDYTETWLIAVYPVVVDEENQEFVISGEASANYEDPWEPAQIQIHEETHREFTRQEDSCVYDCRDICDACGETAYELQMSLHEISVSKENDAFRLTCEHCHESVLVDSYSVNTVSPYYHVYSLDGEILEASSPEFGKEAATGIFAFHEFDAEGNCVCGAHRE